MVSYRDVLSSKMISKNLPNQLVKIMGIGWFFFFLITLLEYPPKWALMDDVGLVQLAKTNFNGLGFFAYIKEFVKGDFGWGMFRPLYGVYSYVFYGLLWKSSFYAYLILFCLNTAIFFLWSFIFRKSIGFIDPIIDKQKLNFYSWLFFVSCFLFTPHINLFFFSSLQERLLLLFGGVAALGLIVIYDSKQNIRLGWLSLFAGIIAALLSKASAIFLIPPCVIWMFLVALQRKSFSLLSAAISVGLIGICFGYFFLLIRSGYTEGYQLRPISELLAQKRFCFLITIVLTELIILLLAWFKCEKTFDWSRLSWVILWPFAALCFLIVLLPWGRAAGYYFIPMGPFLIGSTLLIVYYLDFFFPNMRGNWVVLSAVILLGAYSGKRINFEARQNYGAGLVIDVIRKEIISKESSVLIYMPQPCLEASVHLSTLLDKPKLITLFTDAGNSLVSDGSLFVVNRDCPEIPPQFRIKREVLHYHPWGIYEVGK